MSHSPMSMRGDVGVGFSPTDVTQKLKALKVNNTRLQTLLEGTLEERDKCRGEYELLLAQFRVLQSDYVAKSSVSDTLALQVQELGDLHFSLSRSLQVAQEALGAGEASAGAEAERMAAEVERMRGAMEAESAAVREECALALEEARRAFSADLLAAQESQAVRLAALEFASTGAKGVLEEELARTKRAWEEEVRELRHSHAASLEGSRARREEDLAVERARSTSELLSLRAWANGEIEECQKALATALQRHTEALDEQRREASRVLVSSEEAGSAREGGLRGELSGALEALNTAQSTLAQWKAGAAAQEREVVERERASAAHAMHVMQASHQRAVEGIHAGWEARLRAGVEQAREEGRVEVRVGVVAELERRVGEEGVAWREHLAQVQSRASVGLRALEEKHREVLRGEKKAGAEALAAQRTHHTATLSALKREHEHALAAVWSAAAASGSGGGGGGGGGGNPDASGAAALPSMPTCSSGEVNELRGLVANLRAELASSRASIAAHETRVATLEAEVLSASVSAGISSSSDFSGATTTTTLSSAAAGGAAMATSTVEAAIGTALAAAEAQHREALKGVEHRASEGAIARDATIAELKGQVAGLLERMHSSSGGSGGSGSSSSGSSPSGSEPAPSLTLDAVMEAMAAAGRAATECALIGTRSECARDVCRVRAECENRVQGLTLRFEQKLREMERAAAVAMEGLRREATEARKEASATITAHTLAASSSASSSSSFVASGLPPSLSSLSSSFSNGFRVGGEASGVSACCNTSSLAIEAAAGEALKAAERTYTAFSRSGAAPTASTNASSTSTTTHSLLAALIVQREAAAVAMRELRGRFFAHLDAVGKGGVPAWQAVKDEVDAVGAKSLRGAMATFEGICGSLREVLASATAGGGGATVHGGASVGDGGSVTGKSEGGRSSSSKSGGGGGGGGGGKLVAGKLSDALERCTSLMTSLVELQERAQRAVLAAGEKEASTALDVFRVGEVARGEVESKAQEKELAWEVKLSALTSALVAAHFATGSSSSSSSSGGGGGMNSESKCEEVVVSSVKREMALAWESLRSGEDEKRHPHTSSSASSSFHTLLLSPGGSAFPPPPPLQQHLSGASGGGFGSSPPKVPTHPIPHLPLSPPMNPLSPQSMAAPFHHHHSSSSKAASTTGSVRSSALSPPAASSHPPHHSHPISHFSIPSLLSLSHTFTSTLTSEREAWEEKYAALSASLAASNRLNGELTDALSAAEGNLRVLRAERAAIEFNASASTSNFLPASLTTSTTTTTQQGEREALARMHKEHTESLRTANAALTLALERRALFATHDHQQGSGSAAVPASAAVRSHGKRVEKEEGEEEEEEEDADHGNDGNGSDSDGKDEGDEEEEGGDEGYQDLSSLRTALWKARVRAERAEAAAGEALASAAQAEEECAKALGECQSRCTTQLSEATVALTRQCSELAGALEAKERQAAALSLEITQARVAMWGGRRSGGGGAGSSTPSSPSSPSSPYRHTTTTPTHPLHSPSHGGATAAADAAQIASLKTALAGATAALASMQATASASKAQAERALTALARLSSASEEGVRRAKESEFALQGLARDAVSALSVSEGEWKAKFSALEAAYEGALSGAKAEAGDTISASIAARTAALHRLASLTNSLLSQQQQLNTSSSNSGEELATLRSLTSQFTQDLQHLTESHAREVEHMLHASAAARDATLAAARAEVAGERAKSLTAMHAAGLASAALSEAAEAAAAERVAGEGRLASALAAMKEEWEWEVRGVEEAGQTALNAAAMEFNRELEAAQESARGEIQALEAQVAHLQELLQECGDARERTAALEIENEGLQSALTRCQASLEEASVAAAAAVEDAAQRSARATTLTNASELALTRAAADTAVAEARARVSQVESKCAGLQQEISVLSAKCGELEGTLAGCESAHGRIVEGLSSRVSRLSGEVGVLGEREREGALKVAALEDTLASLRASLEQQGARLKESRGECEAAGVALEECERVRLVAACREAELVASLGRVNGEVVELRGSLEEAKEEVARVKERASKALAASALHSKSVAAESAAEGVARVEEVRKLRAVVVDQQRVLAAAGLAAPSSAAAVAALSSPPPSSSKGSK